ncbi:hypothetical protein BOTBODRAFT_31337 [Botryobasidium botryosum FD-172 SS1]|uniref:Translocon-associated protein subunit alpha n=1 Tax=Botryobasidium botryosum (strain FD-172 SS1) TaxID=930990 RepID=A0A067MWI2_BOTB1|nr:hypothetical protein BOTBODRAFT_31337 [Botryobasidium botryosum FD-172 SS1]
MRLFSLLFGASIFASTLAAVASETTETPVLPEIVASAEFAESNPFGHVVNGERNQMLVTVENKSPANITLVGFGGSFAHAETGRHLRNTTTQAYNVVLPGGTKASLPYLFYSEITPSDVRLTLWADIADGSEKHRVIAHDSIVTVVEPEASIFDLKLLSVYIIVAGLLGGGSYLAYQSFLTPQQKKKPQVSAPVGPVTATGAGGYQEEWIPEHHLKSRKTGKKEPGAVSSGDESGPEKRKGKKRN